MRPQGAADKTPHSLGISTRATHQRNALEERRERQIKGTQEGFSLALLQSPFWSASVVSSTAGDFASHPVDEKPSWEAEEEESTPEQILHSRDRVGRALLGYDNFGVESNNGPIQLPLPKWTAASASEPATARLAARQTHSISFHVRTIRVLQK